MVVQFSSRGNLKQYLRKQRPHRDESPPTCSSEEIGPPLTAKNLISYSYQVAKGMEYLSSKRVKNKIMIQRHFI